jgi:hypothetical protein
VPSYVIKAGKDDDRYFIWSTVVDAPTTYLLSERVMRDYLLPRNASDLERESVQLCIDRAKKKGSSGFKPFDELAWGDEVIMQTNEKIGRTFDDDEAEIKGFRLVSREDVVAYLKREMEKNEL